MGPAGLKLARALAMATYRSAVEFELRFGAAAGAPGARFQLSHRGLPVRARRRLCAELSRRDFLALSESIDLHRMDATLVRTPATLIAVREDQLVPFHDMQGLAARLNGPRQLIEINSIFGHDAFLKEGAALTPIVKRAVCGAAQLMSKEKPRKALSTRSVRAGLESDAQHGSVVPPIYLSTNFAFEAYRKPRKYDYSRSGNPTRDQLAGALADLEGGAGAVITCTGLAAITLVLATLPQGARVLAPHDCYGGTYRLLAALHAQGKLRVDFIDQGDAGGARAPRSPPSRRSCGSRRRATRCCASSIFAPSAEAAHAVGALVAADNTFLSPLWQQPLALGADLVMHSTTKYLNGHSDVVGGAVIAATAGAGGSLLWWANVIGVTGAPFDSFLTLRGVRSLHARMRVHAENTAAVVACLQGHSAVSRVFYPGLADHPGHEHRAPPADRASAPC